eukprot:11168457-Lingulodinium_polyedra.AAC.1
MGAVVGSRVPSVWGAWGAVGPDGAAAPPEPGPCCATAFPSPLASAACGVPSPPHPLQRRGPRR